MNPQSGTMRPHRTLRLLADEMAIQDGQIPFPTVGQVGVFWLLFVEVPLDAHDPTLSTIEADAEPLAPPVLDPPPDSPPSSPRSWTWRILLRGDGWSATWYSPRPAVGRVRLTGRLVGDFAYATTGSVRGRVTTARRLDDAAAGGRHEPGVLAELDLDDVPPPALRPSIVPRALSAAGRVLWVADEQLPLVVRMNLDDLSDVREFALPARISPDPGRSAWQLHADPDGCWVAGWYGIFRCSSTGAVQRLGEHSVEASTTHNGVLLNCTGETTATRLGLWYPNGEHTDAEVPAGQICAITGHRNGFWILMRRRGAFADTKFVVAVRVDGQVRVGEQFDDVDDYAILTAEPPSVIDLRGTVRALRTDLRVDDPTRWPLPGLSGGTVDGWVWVVHHDRNRDLRDIREYWQLSLADPATGLTVTRVEIHTPAPGVTVDGAGTVWITDGRVCPVHSHSGALPGPLAVAELVDRRRSTR